MEEEEEKEEGEKEGGEMKEIVAPGKMKMSFQKPSKKNRSKFAYNDEEVTAESPSGESPAGMSGSKLQQSYARLSQLFSSIDRIQQRGELDQSDSKKVSQYIQQTEVLLAQMQKEVDTVSQCDDSLRVKAKLNQMSLMEEEVGEILKILKSSGASGIHLQAVEEWMETLKSPPKPVDPPSEHSAEKANFETNDSRQGAVEQALCKIEQERISTISLKNAHLDGDLLSICGSRELGEGKCPAVAYRWLGEASCCLANLKPEEIGFHEPGWYIESDCKRGLIWHSSDQRIKAFPAPKPSKGKKAPKLSKYTLWAGEASS